MSDPKQDEATLAEDLSEKYLTTKQVAALLHVKERKIYELAAAGEIPGTRALGKWLFEREAIYSWLEGHNNGVDVMRRAAPPNVVLGSHDPLLEWALRESKSGLASFLDGSFDGLTRFANAEGIVAGIHIADSHSDAWNVPVVSDLLENQPVVLTEWAWRERGLIVADGNPLGIETVDDIAGRKVATRQNGAGTQILFEHLLRKHDIAKSDLTIVGPARTENDAALAVLDGEADATFGLKCIARQFRLDFVPVVWERFDLLVWRREWFESPFQRLMAFAHSEAFRKKAEVLTGYDISGLGTIHFNGKRAG